MFVKKPLFMMCGVYYYIIVYCELSNERSQFPWWCSTAVRVKFTIFTRTLGTQHKCYGSDRIHRSTPVTKTRKRLLLSCMGDRVGNRDPSGSHMDPVKKNPHMILIWCPP